MKDLKKGLENLESKKEALQKELTKARNPDVKAKLE
jgi:hypothetical protein